MKNVNKVIPGEPSWMSKKAIEFKLSDSGRTPATLQERFMFIWNADIFIGVFPLLKGFTLINLVISILF